MKCFMYFIIENLLFLYNNRNLLALIIISYVFGVFVPHLVLTFYVYIIIIYLTHTHLQHTQTILLQCFS